MKKLVFYLKWLEQNELKSDDFVEKTKERF